MMMQAPEASQSFDAVAPLPDAVAPVAPPRELSRLPPNRIVRSPILSSPHTSAFDPDWMMSLPAPTRPFAPVLTPPAPAAPLLTSELPVDDCWRFREVTVEAELERAICR